MTTEKKEPGITEKMVKIFIRSAEEEKQKAQGIPEKKPTQPANADKENPSQTQ